MVFPVQRRFSYAWLQSRPNIVDDRLFFWVLMIHDSRAADQDITQQTSIVGPKWSEHSSPRLLMYSDPTSVLAEPPILRVRLPGLQGRVGLADTLLRFWIKLEQNN